MQSSKNSSMPPFGENLRREREMRGVTLEEIATATKISVRFLEAIEAEEFSKLPGGIFTRSFLRTYDKYLGLDDERVLAEFQLIAGPMQEADLARVPVRRPSAPTQGSRTPWLALLVAAVLLAGGYALFRYSRRAADVSGNVGQATPVIPSPSAAVPAPAPESATALLSTAPSTARPSASEAGRLSETPGQPLPPVPASTPPSTTSSGLTAAPGMLTLQVAAAERSWVAVEADGKTVLQRVQYPNEVETLQARESFAVTTGNAQGIILTLNGETLKPLGRRGEVKSIRLSRSDLKNPAP
jgi:cytoskeleton protein RodZ